MLIVCIVHVLLLAAPEPESDPIFCSVSPPKVGKGCMHTLISYSGVFFSLMLV